MSKNIVIKIKKAGNRLTLFNIVDNYGNTLATNITKKQLISGVGFTVNDNVTVVTITSVGTTACCSKSWNISVGTTNIYELAAIQFEPINTANLWRHLTDPTLYNNFYGCIAPYIIEYPFSYEYYDEIVQNVKDYTKVYKYLASTRGVFDDNRKVETDNVYFNKVVVYNDQQSSGIINLVAKPVNNLRAYNTYPIIGTDSKTATFTKSDNFYQYNTFWSVVKDKMEPLFTNSCQSMSIDKEINQDNMDYTTRSFRKDTIRAKDLKLRHILDNTSSSHLVSQILIAPAQISYK